MIRVLILLLMIIFNLPLFGQKCIVPDIDGFYRKNDKELYTGILTCTDSVYSFLMKLNEGMLVQKIMMLNDTGSTILAEENFKSGILDGKSKYYDQKGQLFKEVTYSRGKKNGIEIIYTDEKVKISESTYLDGKLKSEKEFNKLGQVVSSGHFIDSPPKKNGIWNFYYTNGKRAYDVRYLNGKLWEVTNTFDMEGNSLKISNIKNGNGYLDQFLEFNNQLCKEYTSNYKDGELNAEFITYYNCTNKIREIYTYKNGVKEGPYTKYYLNGQTMVTGNYKNDITLGNFKYFDLNGNLTYIKNYINSTEYTDYRIHPTNCVLRKPFLLV